jgi:hypothetical protein
MFLPTLPPDYGIHEPHYPDIHITIHQECNDSVA